MTMSVTNNKRLLTLFYDWSSPPSRAVLMLCKQYLNEDEIKYKEIRLNKNEHKSEAFTKINPV
jgi:glutathione S-transferase